MLTVEKIHSLFVYRDGNLYKKMKSGALATKPSGTISHNGYVKITIEGASYLLHRVIYFLHNNSLPDFLDHIDRNPLNNKIENLRACSKSQNNMNSKKRKSNQSGHRGVSFHKRSQKWVVEVQVNKKRNYFGLYSDYELACLVSDEARNLYHKEFANHA